MDKKADKKPKEEKVVSEDIVEETVEDETVSKEEYEAMKQIASQFESLSKRMTADYQNLQRRVQEEKVSWIRQANKELLLKLLPVLDTLMLAEKHVQDKGLSLAIQQFTKVLEDEGVKKIDTKDKEFDPMTMECVTTQKVEGKTNKVIEVIRVGYILDEHVLRSAQVIVGE